MSMEENFKPQVPNFKIFCIDMKKMKILIVILVSISFLISPPLSAQSSFKNKGKRASLVKVDKVQYFDVAEKIESIGRLVSVNPTIISSKINQEILKIHFKLNHSNTTTFHKI